MLFVCQRLPIDILTSVLFSTRQSSDCAVSNADTSGMLPLFSIEGTWLLVLPSRTSRASTCTAATGWRSEELPAEWYQRPIFPRSSCSLSIQLSLCLSLCLSVCSHCYAMLSFCLGWAKSDYSWQHQPVKFKNPHWAFGLNNMISVILWVLWE